MLFADKLIIIMMLIRYVNKIRIISCVITGTTAGFLRDPHFEREVENVLQIIISIALH